MKKTFALLCAAVVTVMTLGVSLPATAASRQSQFGPAAHHRVPFEAHGNYAYYNGHRGDRQIHAEGGVGEPPHGRGFGPHLVGRDVLHHRLAQAGVE